MKTVQNMRMDVVSERLVVSAQWRFYRGGGCTSWSVYPRVRRLNVVYYIDRPFYCQAPFHLIAPQPLFILPLLSLNQCICEVLHGRGVLNHPATSPWEEYLTHSVMTVPRVQFANLSGGQQVPPWLSRPNLMDGHLQRTGVLYINSRGI